MSDDETPEQRFARKLQEARRMGAQEWADQDTKKAYQDIPGDAPAAEEKPKEDSIQDLRQRLFHPEWAYELGDRAGETIKKSPAAHGAAKAVAQKLVDYAKWVQSRPGEKVLPAPARDAGRAVQEGMWEKLWGKERAAQLRQQLEEQRRREALPPVDAGEIDEPVRQPVTMQREFSNDEEKEAYLERVRRAMAVAGKK